MIPIIIVLYLASHSYQHLLKEWLNYVLLTLYQSTLCSILYSLHAYIKHHSCETTLLLISLLIYFSEADVNVNVY